jgi:hypothetical protein
VYNGLDLRISKLSRVDPMGGCRAELKPALAELDAGGGTDLDIEAIIQRGREILASEGIVD